MYSPLFFHNFIACVHQLSSVEQANQWRLWRIYFFSLRHVETMLHTTEPFLSSVGASLLHCGSIYFFLPVPLSLGENFCAKVGFVALYQTQLDGQIDL